MKLKILAILILCLQILLPQTAWSQSTRGHYLYSAVGSGYAHIKDTGTSPLRYHGIYSDATAGYINNDTLSEFRIYGDIAYTIATTLNTYGMHHLSGGLQISYLRTADLFKQQDTRLRLGGTFYAGAMGEYNESFQNASLNIDYLACLSLSSQIEHDFILPEKDKKFLFINYHRPRRSFRLFFGMDLPALLLNGRPEFPYLNPEDLDFFSRRFYLGGYKMGTDLGVKQYLKNGNIIEIKYCWDMYTGGNKDIYLVEKASHSLTASFYFKLN